MKYQLMRCLINEHKFYSFWQKLGGVDLRTLAFFRIMLAISCMAEVLILWPDIPAFLSNNGLNPHPSITIEDWLFRWSLYYLSENISWTHCLFVLTFLVNIMLMLGFRTRIFIVFSWVLMVSLTNRVEPYLSGAQMQLRILLFWAMFLPIGARFSLDSALYRKTMEHNKIYISVATLAILIQETYLYTFGAIQKTGGDWNNTFNAVYYVTQASHITSPIGYFLGQSLELTQVLTLFVYYLELFSIVFLFSPLKTAHSRLIILPFLIILHVGFALFMQIGFFPLVSITGLVIFIPGLFWDKMLSWFNRRPSRSGIVIYYDQDCGFCRKTCQIFKELGLPPETLIEPAQGTPEIYSIMQRNNSWVVKDGKGTMRIGWEAVAWCWRRSPIFWPLGIVFKPKFMRPLGDIIYQFIASNRRKFGNLSSRFLPDNVVNPVFHLSKLMQGIIAFWAILIMIWNVGHLPNKTLGSFEKPLHNMLSLLGLWQQWSFFAPNPTHATRWVVVEGNLSDGRVVDLLHGLAYAPDHSQPRNGYAAYPSHAWIRFFLIVNPDQNQTLLGRYFCSSWKNNDDHSRVTSVIFTRYTQPTPAPGLPKPHFSKLTFSYNCGLPPETL